VPINTNPNNPDNGLLTKINNIEDDLNKLKNVFTTWTPASGDGGLALKTASTSWYTAPITLTTQPDISHPNITH